MKSNTLFSLKVLSLCTSRCFSKTTKKRVPKGYWDSNENRRKLFQKIANELDIKKYEDWGKVSTETVSKKGACYLLEKFKGSLFNLLCDVFPEVKWEVSWFNRAPRSYWSNLSNRKKHLEEIAKKLEIKSPEDWGKVSYRKLLAICPGALLSAYNNSLLKLLRKTFIDIQWKEEWFHNIPSVPAGFWRKKENQRNFLDSLFKKLNIKDPRNWGLGKHAIVIENGGRSLLLQYGGSLSKALRNIYPGSIFPGHSFFLELQWRNLNSQKYSPAYWKILSNHRTFLENFASDYHISNPSDWRRVSGQLVAKRGGSGLLRRYNNSLFNVLQTVYPMTDWKEVLKLSSIETAPQIAVLGLTSKLLSK